DEVESDRDGGIVLAGKFDFGDNRAQKLADYAGLPCRVARGCRTLLKLLKKDKHRSIISLETKAAPQASQDSSVQITNGDLRENSTRENFELHVDAISDDQPLSRWFEGIQSSAIVNNTTKVCK
ncbi:hypothetical protein Tco_1088959, partial [Tanacetum coccineum]